MSAKPGPMSRWDFHLVDDAGGDAAEEAYVEGIEIGRHAVDRVHGAQRQHLAAAAPVAHLADAMHQQQHREGLAYGVVEAGVADLVGIDRIGLAQDVERPARHRSGRESRMATLLRLVAAMARCELGGVLKLTNSCRRRRVKCTVTVIMRPSVGHEISRFPRKELPHMPGSPTTPDRAGARDVAPVRVAFHSVNGVGIRDRSFAAQWLAYALPTDASSLPSRTTTHGSGPMWIATP
jgi:hypothetical protein